MGVDISFHIEVRYRDKWRPLVWQTPMELKSFVNEKDKEKERNSNNCCFWCRYYHFSDFIEDHATRGLPSDVSPEMKVLEKYEMGNDYFLLSDLTHFYDTEEKKMLSHMLQSRDYQMVKQLNRIEKYVKQKPLAKKDTLGYSYYEERTIKEIYDDFQEECWLFLRLQMAVHSFLDGADIFADDNEVRILYAIC